MAPRRKRFKLLARQAKRVGGDDWRHAVIERSGLLDVVGRRLISVGWQEAQRKRKYMRAVLLVSCAAAIRAIAATFGIPAVYRGGEPVMGGIGSATGLVSAAIPPALVAAFRKIKAARTAQ